MANPLTTSSHTQADEILNALLTSYASAARTTTLPAPGANNSTDFYCANKLILYLRDLAPSEKGRSNITRQVLAYIFHSAGQDGSQAIPPLHEILPRARIGRVNPAPYLRFLEEFAADVLDCFFVPFLAQGGKTSALPSRASFLTSRSPVPEDHTVENPDRRPQLRTECLTREDGFCVITGCYDHGEYLKLRRAGVTTAPLQAAHIIPHALSRSSEAYEFVWRVLDMFDPGVRGCLEGEFIDHPHNAFLLHSELHLYFGQLLWWFEEVPDELNTYTTHTARRFPPTMLQRYLGKRVIFTSRGGINPPDRRLLRLHAACARILDMSGAAEYVEQLQREAEELRQLQVLKQDGSSNLYALFCARGLGIMVR
ncbi:hypothetical protein K440DRAFT_665151 [Wilcoxina mikolae CBS 423.85]|nr:hypothetical protein K440DRAFT_665151 [Wilcoxina mikolae CBS 423.85]